MCSVASGWMCSFLLRWSSIFNQVGLIWSSLPRLLIILTFLFTYLTSQILSSLCMASFIVCSYRKSKSLTLNPGDMWTHFQMNFSCSGVLQVLVCSQLQVCLKSYITVVPNLFPGHGSVNGNVHIFMHQTLWPRSWRPIFFFCFQFSLSWRLFFCFLVGSFLQKQIQIHLLFVNFTSNVSI